MCTGARKAQDGTHFFGSLLWQYSSDSNMCDARKRCRAYAMPGRSFRAFFGAYGVSGGEGSWSHAGVAYAAAMAGAGGAQTRAGDVQSAVADVERAELCRGNAGNARDDGGERRDVSAGVLGFVRTRSRWGHAGCTAVGREINTRGRGEDAWDECRRESGKPSLREER